MSRAGTVGLRRKGDVEEQIRKEDQETLEDDEDTNAWVRRQLTRMEKVRRKEERNERKKALQAKREGGSNLDD